jgi:signal transduction histidine kinase
MPANFGLLIALYSVTVHGPVVANRVALGVGLVGVPMAITRYYDNANLRSQGYIVIAMAAVVLGVWAFGERRRTNALYVVQLEERAAQLERDRDREARLAVSAERTRIAREIHDVVAHGLSIMIVQADGGLYAADQRPDQAKKALATIGDTGRDALTEMRQLLGLLKEESAPADQQPRPQPGVSQIPELVENVRDAGLAVELTTTGTARELPALLGLTAYRIVQEGLTNALKHAGPGAQATVGLDFGSQELTVAVGDDGRGAAVSSNGSGHGLVGMRQRVSVSGGTVTAGPRAGGGYIITARLPYDPTTTTARADD